MFDWPRAGRPSVAQIDPTEESTLGMLMASFGSTLRSFRERAGMSQRGLAAASGINPAIVNRFESGDRGPSGPEQVIALARALELSPADEDALLASAGYWPGPVRALGPQDETLLVLARALAHPRLGGDAKARLRAIVRQLAEHWLADAERPTSS